MMAARFHTHRIAAMLARELRLLAAEKTAVSYDGGTGQIAVAAISALPPGPRRDLEVALWARRVIDGPGRFALLVHEGISDAELQAMVELHERVMSDAAAVAS